MKNYNCQIVGERITRCIDDIKQSAYNATIDSIDKSLIEVDDNNDGIENYFYDYLNSNLSKWKDHCSDLFYDLYDYIEDLINFENEGYIDNLRKYYVNQACTKYLNKKTASSDLMRLYLTAVKEDTKVDCELVHLFKTMAWITHNCYAEEYFTAWANEHADEIKECYADLLD
ncbi:MAG: hypothetical protein KBT03_10225 [Bacteroidales bacterium]|nr:hypothetical protein [Candidatus Scybalousia scybalohippi]